MKQALIKLRINFFVGFVAILPLAASVYIFLKLVGFVVGVTDQLLLFLPHQMRETEWKPLFSLLALVVSFSFVTLLGAIAKNMLGKTFLSAIESLALRVPLLNKIYGGTKQIIEAIGASKKGVFQRVVLVRFPYRDSYSVGFVTSESRGEVQEKTAEEVINVFVPTTPNPTSGFLLMVPKQETIELEMSVSDAIKLVISGGAVTPPHPMNSAPAAATNGNS